MKKLNFTKKDQNTMDINISKSSSYILNMFTHHLNLMEIHSFNLFILPLVKSLLTK
jgi:hypothetical protein